MIPFHIETLYRHEPRTNWVLVMTTVAASVVVQSGLLSPEGLHAVFALGKGCGPCALAGHLLAHTNAVHLVGNTLFLWLFGNAVCGVVGNLPYLGIYLALGCLTAFTRLATGAGPVLGADGALAGLLGVCLAFFPFNKVSVATVGRRGFSAGQVPLWSLTLYWLAWEILVALLHLGSVSIWGQLAGASAGLGIGIVALGTSLVDLSNTDGTSLVDYWNSRSGPRRPSQEAAARAELRRMARLYLEQYSALPAIAVDAPAPRRRLTLRQSMRFARTPAAPATPANPHGVQFGANHSATPPPPPPAAKPPPPAPSAWPDHLPESRYFYFDGRRRHGPVTRAQFLAAISGDADTSRWWFWTEGMGEWQTVGVLGYGTARQTAPAPQPADSKSRLRLAAAKPRR